MNIIKNSKASKLYRIVSVIYFVVIIAAACSLLIFRSKNPFPAFFLLGFLRFFSLYFSGFYFFIETVLGTSKLQFFTENEIKDIVLLSFLFFPVEFFFLILLYIAKGITNKSGVIFLAVTIFIEIILDVLAIVFRKEKD